MTGSPAEGDPIADATGASGAATGEVARLCAALVEKELSVRIAAAQALGEVGDASALPHLNRLLSGHTERHEVLAEPPRVPVDLASSALFHGVDWPAIGVILAVAAPFALVTAAVLAVRTIRNRRRSSALTAAACDALARIAERNPHLDWRPQLPQLLDVQDDMLHQNEESRQAASRALEIIRATAAPRYDLPLPAGTTTAQKDALPLAAQAVPSERQALPRPGGPGE